MPMEEPLIILLDFQGEFLRWIEPRLHELARAHVVPILGTHRENGAPRVVGAGTFFRFGRPGSSLPQRTSWKTFPQDGRQIPGGATRSPSKFPVGVPDAVSLKGDVCRSSDSAGVQELGGECINPECNSREQE